jgi:hypothetical protein
MSAIGVGIMPRDIDHRPVSAPHQRHLLRPIGRLRPSRVLNEGVIQLRRDFVLVHVESRQQHPLIVAPVKELPLRHQHHRRSVLADDLLGHLLGFQHTEPNEQQHTDRHTSYHGKHWMVVLKLPNR